MNEFAKMAIAPMIDWSNTHFRVLLRMLAPRAVVYTEMQTHGAIVNNPTRALDFHSMEHPIALQLGGANIDQLVLCAKIAEQKGFDEINLNLGCPSDRVQSGRFGACLMAEPDHVAKCIAALKAAVCIPISAKTRIGIDNQDSYEFFADFVKRLVDAGADSVIVHARKAWLKGLNPKQNRTIPPINYEYVYKLKKELSDTPIVINGNINEFSDVHEHLEKVNGVMLGRIACQNPYWIASLHHQLYPQIPSLSRTMLFEKYVAYIETIGLQKAPLSILLKPILGMAHGLPDAKKWRQDVLSTKESSSLKPLWQTVDQMREMEYAKMVANC